jgi:hypothetical protein
MTWNFAAFQPKAFGKGDIPTIIDCLADDVQWEQ